MNKLKVLLTILMGTLIAFSAQRAYYVKTGELSSIYSDIIFTRLAVESQEYTRQIEYGVKNGKSLENFYNISSVLSGVRRCCSYTNGVYIFSSDRRQLYSLNDGGSPVFGILCVPGLTPQAVIPLPQPAKIVRIITVTISAAAACIPFTTIQRAGATS